MITLTRWVLGHKPLVVAVWVTLAVAGVAAIGPADKAFEEQFNIPGKEAFAANSQIAAAYGNGGDVAPLVPVVTLPAGTTVDSPGRARGPRGGPGEGQGRAPGGPDRLVRLHPRPGVRLRRRPHDLRARVRSRPRAASTRARPRPAGPGRARRRHRRRRPGPGDRPRRAARGRRRRRQGRRREHGRRGADRGAAARCSSSPSSSPRGWRSCRC